MQVIQQQEGENRRKALIATIVVHAAILLGFLTVVAWEIPGPPMEDIGVELNFGLDKVGSGDLQTLAQANDSKNREDSQPPKEQAEPVKEVTSKAATTPIEEKDDLQDVATSHEESPVEVKEEKVKTKAEPAPKKEEGKEEAKAEPKVNKSAMMTKGGGNGTAGTSTNPTGNNNGDDASGVGDKGHPEGKLDAKALYGKPGGGTGGKGPRLEMAGWTWEDKPSGKDKTDETGKLVLNVTIDEDGIVENVSVVESTVSAAAANYYKDLVYKSATFKRTGPKPAGGSQRTTGRITYIITAD